MDREISNLYMPLSTSGLSRHTFDVKSRVRIPLGVLFGVILPANKLARQ